MSVHCDRCHKDVDGFEGGPGEMSGGCYVSWDNFMNPGERVICDACMWADPRYIAVYGVVSVCNTSQEIMRDSNG